MNKLLIFLFAFQSLHCANVSYMKVRHVAQRRGAMPQPHGKLIAGVWNIAHRGASTYAPENTIPAFDLALKNGANMFELDVLFTKDLVPVVFHDETLNRTTNGRGNILKKTYKQLQKLDAGSWKHRRYRGTKIPTLDQVLKRYKDKIPINIEIKEESLKIKGLGHTGIAKRVMKVVKKYKMSKQVWISSFNHKIVDAVRAQHKSVPTAYLTEAEWNKPPTFLYNKNIDAWNTNFRIINELVIADYRSRGRMVYAWGTNDLEEIKLLVRMGISGVFVDDPLVFKRYLKSIKR